MQKGLEHVHILLLQVDDDGAAERENVAQVANVVVLERDIAVAPADVDGRRHQREILVVCARHFPVVWPTCRSVRSVRGPRIDVSEFAGFYPPRHRSEQRLAALHLKAQIHAWTEIQRRPLVVRGHQVDGMPAVSNAVNGEARGARWPAHHLLPIDPDDDHGRRHFVHRTQTPLHDQIRRRPHGASRRRYDSRRAAGRLQRGLRLRQRAAPRKRRR